MKAVYAFSQAKTSPITVFSIYLLTPLQREFVGTQIRLLRSFRAYPRPLYCTLKIALSIRSIFVDVTTRLRQDLFLDNAERTYTRRNFLRSPEVHHKPEGTLQGDCRAREQCADQHIVFPYVSRILDPTIYVCLLRLSPPWWLEHPEVGNFDKNSSMVSTEYCLVFSLSPLSSASFTARPCNNPEPLLPQLSDSYWRRRHHDITLALSCFRYSSGSVISRLAQRALIPQEYLRRLSVRDDRYRCIIKRPRRSCGAKTKVPILFRHFSVHRSGR